MCFSVSRLRLRASVPSTCSTWPATLVTPPRRCSCPQNRSWSAISSHKCNRWRLKAAADDAFDGWGREADGASAAAAEASAAQSQGASMPATVFNLVNVIMGAGYVSIPFACRQGGWAALLVLWLLGCVFCYSGHALLQCCRLVDQQNAAAAKAQANQSPVDTSSSSDSSKDTVIAAGGSEQQQQQQQGSAAAVVSAAAGYEAVAGRAFGQLGLAVISGIMYAELLGICCVYVVLEAETLSTLLSSTALGSALGQQFGPSAFGLLASAVMLPTVLLPNLKSLSVLGALGVTAAATVGLALAGLFFTSGPAGISALADTVLLKLQTLPSVLGILAFVYAGHSTFPVIQQSMATRSDGPRAVTYGYAITALICTVLGGFGYALYGSQTVPVITANLPPLSLIALVCTALTLCNPFSAFALTLEPVAVAVQNQWSKGRNSISGGGSSCSGEVPYTVRAFIRLGLAVACCGTAMVLPYVAEVMAFVGALLTMSISLIIPALMHISLMGRELPWWLLLFDLFVLLLGVTCAAVGATSALQSLQEKLAAAAAKGVASC